MIEQSRIIDQRERYLPIVGDFSILNGSVRVHKKRLRFDTIEGIVLFREEENTVHFLGFVEPVGMVHSLDNVVRPPFALLSKGLKDNEHISRDEKRVVAEIVGTQSEYVLHLLGEETTRWIAKFKEAPEPHITEKYMHTVRIACEDATGHHTYHLGYEVAPRILKDPPTGQSVQYLWWW